jgi:thiamine phosphate synthase YjbQ (UPF0047 family)
MKIYNKTISVDTVAGRVSYHNITEQVKAFLDETGVKIGNVLIQSPHTTCSVMFEEFVHDTDYNGDEYLQVDLDRILDKIIPRELTEKMDYKYPGPKHEAFMFELGKKNPSYPPELSSILNGDAHLRASFMGNSKSFIIDEGKIQIGTVGYIYFVDFDQNRERQRTCHIQIIGE